MTEPLADESGQPLDSTALARLQRIGGPTFVGEMIALFFKHTPVWIETMHTLAPAGDLAEVERAAHSLKSSATTLGAVCVRELARRIETEAAEKNRVVLPLLVAELQRAYALVQPRLAAVQMESSSRKKIAVVEDNDDNRLLIRAILGGAYEVVEYINGFEAVAGLRAARPDLVLLDVMLPQMDGTEVLRQMRADEALRDLPVIALTAHAMAGDREKFLLAGFNDYVSKPIVDEAVLLGVIERWLQRRGGE